MHSRIREQYRVSYVDLFKEIINRLLLVLFTFYIWKFWLYSFLDCNWQSNLVFYPSVRPLPQQLNRRPSGKLLLNGQVSFSLTAWLSRETLRFLTVVMIAIVICPLAACGVNRWHSICFCLGTETSQYGTGVDIVSGSHLPCHSEIHLSYLTKEKIQVSETRC